MSDPINIDEIMQELRNNAKNKSYPKEAIAFDAVCARKKETEDLDFLRSLWRGMSAIWTAVTMWIMISL